MSKSNTTNKRKATYANASHVLPPELVKEIQKYFSGLLWVPEPEKFFEERRVLVIALHNQNVPIDEIGQLAGVTRRRVYQIISESKKAD